MPIWLICVLCSSLGLSWMGLYLLPGFGCFLSCVRKVSKYYLIKYFLRSFLSSQVLSLFSFWDHYNVNVSAFSVDPEIFETYFYSLFFLFTLFLRSDFYHLVFFLTYSFFVPQFLSYWFFSSVFFISVIVLFISFCLLFNSSSSLFNIYFILLCCASILFWILGSSLLLLIWIVFLVHCLSLL